MENEEIKKEIVPIKEILFKDYLPYWPYFVLVAMLSLLAAFVNLRYQTPIYQVNAMMMIKPEKEGINTMMEKLVGGQGGGGSSSNLNDKLYVLKSDRIKALAAKMAHLQVRIDSKGKVSSLENYINMPMQVLILQPDSVKDFSGDFTYDPQGKGIVLGGQLYPFNRKVVLAGNEIVFKCVNPNGCASNKNIHSLSLFSAISAGYANSGGFAVVPAEKSSSIINLILTTNVPEKGVAMLDAIMQAYKTVSMDDKLQQAKNTIQFVDERLKELSGDLDSVEGSIEAFKRKNGIADSLWSRKCSWKM
jgi:tyrosine-protein kinase Etk/Wzc